MLLHTIILIDKDHEKQELAKIRSKLLLSGYSHSTISKNMTPALSKPQNSDNNLPATILPYIKGTTDRIGKILRKYDIKTIFRLQTKNLSFFRSPKDIILLESQGIYEKNLNSALFTHSHYTSHWIDFSHTKTIASLDKESHRVFREAIEIEKRPDCLNNRNDAKRLPNTWKPLISKPAKSLTPICLNSNDAKNSQEIYNP